MGVKRKPHGTQIKAHVAIRRCGQGRDLDEAVGGVQGASDADQHLKQEVMKRAGESFERGK